MDDLILSAKKIAAPAVTDSKIEAKLGLHDSLSLLDTLASIASGQSPIRGGDNNNNNNNNGNAEMYFAPTERRSRAMSEPWTARDRNWSESQSATTESAQDDMATNSASIPQMLDKYSYVYNKNGRIGIYSREERNAIIARFRDKRRRRVWKKKIRYHCRKNLADRRIRVKGRFVKAAESEAIEEMIEREVTVASENLNNLFATDITTLSPVGGKPPLSPAPQTKTIFPSFEAFANAAAGMETEGQNGDRKLIATSSVENKDEENNNDREVGKRMRRHSVAY
jgi:hypothetical protein